MLFVVVVYAVPLAPSLEGAVQMWERQKTAIVGQLLTVIAFPVLSGAVMAERRVEHFVPLNHFRDCDGWSEMVVVPTGSYQMGATEEEFRGAEKKYQFMHGIETPKHTVQVKSFALARFHVTRKQFAIFAKETGFSGKGCRIFKHTDWQFDPDADRQNPGFAQTDNDPVVCVSWNDAQQYIAWLNSKFAGTGAHQ